MFVTGIRELLSWERRPVGLIWPWSLPQLLGMVRIPLFVEITYAQKKNLHFISLLDPIQVGKFLKRKKKLKKCTEIFKSSTTFKQCVARGLELATLVFRVKHLNLLSHGGVLFLVNPGMVFVVTELP